MSRYKTVLLFGAPGAGKGTQGAILARVPGFYHCACGDVFRNIDITSELGKVFYDYSSRGELVPDEVTVKMWARTIQASTVLGQYKPNLDMLILDGIPRTVEQARIMEQYIDVLKIVHLECKDEDEMIRRLRRRALKSNRHDDADVTVIRNRWDIYKKETAPVLDCYDAELICEIDSIGSPGSILKGILDIVVPIQNTHFKAFDG